MASGENYVGSVFARVNKQGIGALIASGLENLFFYANALPDLLLPGLSNERPWYAPVTLDRLTSAHVGTALTTTIATLIVVASIIGMLKRRSEGGLPVLFYFGFYAACLAVWPWRHERFLWPIVPFVWSYFPAGLIGLAGTKPVGVRVTSACSYVLLAAVCVWQAIVSYPIIEVNRELVRDRDAFHATQHPGFYFADWRAAGMWLRDHSATHARVLTWHAAVGENSKRFQRRVQFETMTPEKLRKEIEAFSATYLVVSSGQFGDGFGWRQIYADPVYHFDVVYNNRGVAVIEVSPNRTEKIATTAYDDWLQTQLSSIEAARNASPGRLDLAIRHASLLREQNKNREAVAILRDLIQRGTRTVRVYSDLGWTLFEMEDYQEAARLLDEARLLPNAESIAGSLAEGAEIARSREREKSYGTETKTIESRVKRVNGLISVLRYDEAESKCAAILESNPDDGATLFQCGRIHFVKGESTAAQECFERAVSAGISDAIEWLRMLRLSIALENGSEAPVTIGNENEVVNPATPDSYVKLAQLYRDLGFGGRALALLEDATQRFPDEPRLQRLFAELLLKFAEPDKAQSILESLLKRLPADESIQRSLDAAKACLRVPQM
jgi:tetratricopeptide (TPR) repeat protein